MEKFSTQILFFLSPNDLTIKPMSYNFLKRNSCLKYDNEKQFTNKVLETRQPRLGVARAYKYLLRDNTCISNCSEKLSSFGEFLRYIFFKDFAVYIF